MARGSNKLAWVLVGAAAALVVIWLVWSKGGARPEVGVDGHVERPGPVDPGPGPGPASPKKDDDGKASKPVAPLATKPAPPKPAPPKPVDTAKALEAYGKGMDLLKADKPVAARAALSEALLSGGLVGQREEKAREELTKLAEKTIFSDRYFDGDPYVSRYKFLPGEYLVHIERRKLGLHVPPKLIERINNIRAPQIRAGQALKMVHGPFHAIVHKGKFIMDIYLHREGLEKVFIKRVRVGLGKDGTTPVGSWRVKLGSKQPNSVWYPPPNSPHRKALRPGHPDYPLGRKGYWIGLEGTDEKTRSEEGYGIHGTNDPKTIGKEDSLGCIRLGDKDIELVFSVLYEKWSTVEIRP